MLHIILGILKMIGIILLILLGVLVGLLLLMLFFPFVYQADIKKDTDIYGRAKVSWLFHLVAFYVYYEETLVRIKLRIFGIPFHLGKEKKEKPEREKKVRKKAKKEMKQDKKPKEPIELKEPESIEEAISQKEAISNKKSTSQEEPVTVKDPKISIFTKIKNAVCNFIRNLMDKIRNIKYTCLKIYDKIKELKHRADEVIGFFKDEDNKKAFIFIKNEFKGILNHIKPKKFLLKLTYGTGDPESTGYILAGIGIAYPIFKNSCQIVPDFENKVLEGSVFLKGRIQLFVLLWTAFKLYRDKNIKNLIHKVQILRRK